LTGRVADGWIPSLRGEIVELAPMVQRLDDAARAAGRQPRDLRRILNVSGRIRDGRSEGAFDGPVDQWVDGLSELVVAYGFDTFLFWGEGDGQLERFATEVVPRAREQLVGDGPQPQVD
jgi:alkanesulfonate monooxygenase SsuD/methylene tetrahydromethanopterin reductase-like flavin-dependent oxidoreductase (luciferase family)